MNRNQIPFPSNYPTTALLGCVDVIVCLEQKEYQQQYIENGVSTEMNASSVCFVCENPRKLILPELCLVKHINYRVLKR